MQVTSIVHSRIAPFAGVLAAIVILGASITPARAEAPDRTAREIEAEREFFFHRRLQIIRPQRRDGPLRYNNISDDEVREIQSAASEVVGNVMVQIGGVTTGCPCEDGPTCTDQVWVETEVHHKPFGLLLSKIQNHWVIGPVQRWWWLYEKADDEEQKKLLGELSACGLDEAMVAWYRQHRFAAPTKPKEKH
jgi:hypothetical protein